MKFIGLLLVVTFMSGCGHIVISKDELARTKKLSRILGHVEGQMQASKNLDNLLLTYDFCKKKTSKTEEFRFDLGGFEKDLKFNRRAHRKRLAKLFENVAETIDKATEKEMCAKGYQWFCCGYQ